jgi:ubiquinone/menaquinone biosynthesis C-methylase UbiE
MLEALVERKPPAQVQPLLSELPHIDLPDASVDSIWGAFVIHEVEPLDELMVEMQRVLRPGGYLAILDWRPDAAHDDGPPLAHRLASDAIIHHLQAAGFQQVSQTWQNEDAYLVEANCYGEKGSGG